MDAVVREFQRDINRMAFDGIGSNYYDAAECLAIGGHFWGPYTKHIGGVCLECNGDGIAAVYDEEEGVGIEECWHCDGQGFVTTKYTRYCDACGHAQYKG